MLDDQSRVAIERMKIEAGIVEAEINTKAQAQSERNEFVADAWQQLHSQAHEAALQAGDQQHEQNMAVNQAQLAQQAQLDQQTAQGGADTSGAAPDAAPPQQGNQ